MAHISETKSLISGVATQEWQEELEKASSGYHITGAWIAIIFNPLFAFTDYLSLQDTWIHLLIVRLTVSFLTLCVLLARNRLGLPSYLVILVPFLLISMQNAYTYSLIKDGHIMNHSLNYMALLIGGGMFILWRWQFSVLVVALSTVVTGIFLQLNPTLSKEQFLVKGGFLLLSVSAFMIVLIKARYDLTIKEIKARLALKASNTELEKQKAIAEESSQKITDSIQYARRIQNSVFGDTSAIKNWFADSFVMLIPKNILSGDFYWFYEDPLQQLKIVVAADCTGHGVPAAMLTILGNSILNEVVIQGKIYEPDQILYALDQRLLESFSKQEQPEGNVNDGMDVSILCFGPTAVTFAAAKNPLCIIKNNTMEVISGSKFPIGSTQYAHSKVFEKHQLALEKGTKLFIYSDGYQDQFGGKDNKKYLSKRFKEFLLQTSTQNMSAQKEALTAEFQNWKGPGKINTDDVLIIGIEI